METIAFKPYACGTMTQPFIDCAIRLAEDDVRADDITEIVCEVAEGTVHRLWEPLASKHRPPTPYAAKFSTPFCMAVGFFDRKAGFAQFTEARIHDPAVLALAAKIRYAINPDDEYPRNFTGHLRATLTDGSQREFRQPYMRGGAHAPLSGGGTGDEVHGQRALRRLEPRVGGTVRRALSRADLFSSCRGSTPLDGVPHHDRVMQAGLVSEDLAAAWRSSPAARATSGGRSRCELAGAGAAVMVNARTSAAEAEAVADEIRQAGGRAAVKIADVADPDAAAVARRGGGRVVRPARHPREQRERAAGNGFRAARLPRVARDPGDRPSTAPISAATPRCRTSIASGSGADREHRRTVGVYRRRRGARTSSPPRRVWSA